jgi:hypothetical protein
MTARIRSVAEQYAASYQLVNGQPTDAQLADKADAVRSMHGVRHRPELVLPQLRKAIRFIAEVAFDLHERGYLSADRVVLPPPQWIIERGLELEVAGDQTERDAKLRDYDNALKLYRAACDEWDKISTLKRLNAQLIEQLDAATSQKRADGWGWERRTDCSLFDPAVLAALNNYAEFLHMFAASSPIIGAAMHQFEAMAARIRETCRTYLLDEILSGRLQGEQHKMAIAALDQHAASGLWPTPELDLNRAEERWRARAS